MKDNILDKFEEFLHWWNQISENNIEYFMELGLDERQAIAFKYVDELVSDIKTNTVKLSDNQWKNIGWCKDLTACDTCQCDVLGTCKVKYSDKEEIHYTTNPIYKCECGCGYYYIDDHDYQICTNCGFRQR